MGVIKRINLKRTAKDVIATNQYMTLGTVNENGQAWVSPVVYAYDASYNLYFMSLPDSRHGRNIGKSPSLSVAIFDSHQAFGEGIGLQILGEAGVVPVGKSISVFKLYFGRKWPYGNLTSIKDFKKFFSIYKYRFYKIKPTEVWMNDPRKEYDRRVRIRL